MISRIDLRGPAGRLTDARTVLPRAALDVEAATAAVRSICDDVRRRGDDAVREATARLDGVTMDALRVPTAALEQALADTPTEVRAALEEAALRARRVHEAQRRRDVTVEVVSGGTVTERWLPVR
ncbi:MAG: histidinol dehydrogenase, partial [Actinomycetota bacterium]|nr:histidinol dehydrogenase [Actinomycetota bacterium]